MKIKNYFTILMTLAGYTMYGQIHNLPDQSPFPKSTNELESIQTLQFLEGNHLNKPSNERTAQLVCDYDTNSYTLRKLVNYKLLGRILNGPNQLIAVGQYFPCPQPLVVKGFGFRAIVVSSAGAKVNMKCAIYEAGADSLYPLTITGSLQPPLATVDVQVDTTGSSNVNNAKFYTAIFPSSLTITKPYIISILNPSTTLPIFTFTNNFADSTITAPRVRRIQDGLKEFRLKLILGNNLGKGIPTRSQNIASGGDILDADLVVIPFVKPANFELSLTTNKDTINVNEPLQIFHTPPPILKEKVYSYAAFVNQVEKSKVFHLGDSVNGKAVWRYTLRDTVNIAYSQAGTYHIAIADTLYGFGSRFFTGYSTKCVDIKTKRIFVKPITGLDKSAISAQNLFIYPNPATSELHIDSEELRNETLSIALLDTYGKKVKSISIPNFPGKFLLETVNITPGVYILSIETSGKTFKRLINIL